MAGSAPEAPTAPSFDLLWEAAQTGDAGSQLALGRHYLAASDFGRARRWLSRAGRNGRPDGLTELAMLELQGLGIAADSAAAREHLTQACEAGDARARYELALLDYRLHRRAEEECLRDLAAAARAGHGPAQRQVALLLLPSDPALGQRILHLAATGGDAIAMSLLARQLADLGAGDAAAWASRARAAGAYCRVHFPPLGADEAGAPAPAATLAPDQIPVPAISTSTTARPQRPLGDERVQIFDGMLSALESEYLIEAAAPFLRPSHTVHPETGQAVRNEMRTSYGYSLHPVEEDFVILALKGRLAAQTGYPITHAEPFALLRYRPGEEYKAHYDYIDPGSGEAGQEIGRFGQREITIFSYLATVERGGQTAFPEHDLAIDCRQGRALMFRNTLSDGSPDLSSLHASVAVEAGEKWIATLWVRGRSLHA